MHRNEYIRVDIERCVRTFTSAIYGHGMTMPKIRDICNECIRQVFDIINEYANIDHNAVFKDVMPSISDHQVSHQNVASLSFIDRITDGPKFELFMCDELFSMSLDTPDLGAGNRRRMVDAYVELAMGLWAEIYQLRLLDGAEALIVHTVRDFTLILNRITNV